MSDKIIAIGNIYYGDYHAGFGGNIVGIGGIAPTLLGGQSDAFNSDRR